MKKNSLKRRLELSEKRERDSRRRMHEMHRQLIRANAISDGSQVMVNMLAQMIAPRFLVSKDVMDEAVKHIYAVRLMEDGGYEFAEKGLIEHEMAADGTEDTP